MTDLHHDKAVFALLNRTIKIQLDEKLSEDEARAIHKQVAALPGIRELDWNIQGNVPPEEADDPDDLYSDVRPDVKDMMVDILGPSKRLTHEFDAVANSEKQVPELVRAISNIPGVTDAHVMHKGPFRGWVPVTGGPGRPKP